MQLASRFSEKRALTITLCWVAALALTGSTDALLFLAPALLIAIPLLCGRYFGEELIAKLAAARQTRKPPRARLVLPLTSSAPKTWRPRGTHLLAFSLAERPPPAALLAQI
jgi:hypothetical protein